MCRYEFCSGVDTRSSGVDTYNWASQQYKYGKYQIWCQLIRIIGVLCMVNLKYCTQVSKLSKEWVLTHNFR